MPKGGRHGFGTVDFELDMPPKKSNICFSISLHLKNCTLYAYIIQYVIAVRFGAPLQEAGSIEISLFRRHGLRNLEMRTPPEEKRRVSLG